MLYENGDDESEFMSSVWGGGHFFYLSVSLLMQRQRNYNA